MIQFQMFTTFGITLLEATTKEQPIHQIRWKVLTWTWFIANLGIQDLGFNMILFGVCVCVCMYIYVIFVWYFIEYFTDDDD